ncbi:MAG: tetratricopeptide repeat protein [Phycisphaerales bacterium]|nr:tetratricopeptide repeat protein [Phycisphaerales bacterium]
MPPPGAPPPYLIKAAELMDAGRFQDAKALLLLSTKKAAPARAFMLLALACEGQGEREAALFHFQRARAADPLDAEIALQYADLLSAAKKPEEAIRTIDAFHKSALPNPPLLMLRSVILSRLGRHDEALKAADDGLKLAPGNIDLLSAKGVALQAMARYDEAIAVLRNANVPARIAPICVELGEPYLAVDEGRMDALRVPDEPSSHGFLAFAMNYDDRVSREELFAVHRAYGQAVARKITPSAQWKCSPDPDRRLRIGFVSPDLRQHAVVSFFRPILTHYDKSEWELRCYSIYGTEDRMSEELKGLSDGWRFIPNAAEGALAEICRDDGVDVLIDLAGLTRAHKLGCFGYTPAPVQMTYLGYPNTTGLSTMGYRLIDAITDPPGSESLATEKLLRLDPCFLCYTPLVDAPVLRERVPLEGRPIALGSFNLPMKMSATNLGLWARVMAALPDATLLLKHATLTSPPIFDVLRRRMSEAGMDLSRVKIVPPTKGYQDHLATYFDMDIALDTYPYHGTTTTCEAMWMGVPVVTLEGDRHASRVGCSLLSVVGAPELIAKDADDYVDRVVALARDHDRLRRYHSDGAEGLRARMLSSPLCDGPRFCRGMEKLVRGAWRDWCQTRGQGARA